MSILAQGGIFQQGTGRVITASQNPSGLAIDGEDNLYFGDVSSGRVDLKRRSAAGAITNLGTVVNTFGGPVNITWSFDLAVNSSNVVFYTYPRIRAAGGGVLEEGGVFQVGAGRLVTTTGDAVGLAFDDAGNMYYGDLVYAPLRVDLKRRSPSGTITNLGTVVDTSGGGYNPFGWSFDLAADHSGTVYYTHPRITLSGGGVLVAGGVFELGLGRIVTTSGDAAGLALDGAGNLYFGDVSSGSPSVDLKRRSVEGVIADLGTAVNTSGGSSSSAWSFDLGIPRSMPEAGLLTLHRLNLFSLASTNGLTPSERDDVDAELFPISVPLTLRDQPKLGKGLVADGVAPLLLRVSPKYATNVARHFHLVFDETGGSIAGGMAGKVRVLQGLNGVPRWSDLGVTNLVIPAGESNAFAFVRGIKPDELVSTNHPAQVNVAVRLLEDGTDSEVGSATFGIRRPPVALAHGYNTDGGTWQPPFLNPLVASRGADFIVRLSYGSHLSGSSGKRDNSYNVEHSFKRNMDYLDRALLFSIECDETSFPFPDIAPTGLVKPPLNDWYFLRYDLVGHSQGGVLARMLARYSTTNEPRFFSGSHPRGRFRRVITIGSPHNGSVIPYYSLALLRKNPLLSDEDRYFVVPAVLRLMGLLQEKFDPFGEEIPAINQWEVDSRARFHLLRTSIDAPPNIFPPAYGTIGLLGVTDSGLYRKDVVLPFGSDGVVDYESQAGGAGSKVTGLTGQNISHSGPFETLVFGVDSLSFQTGSSIVGDKVIALLDGPDSNFRPFYPVVSLTQDRKDEIDAVVPGLSIADVIRRRFFSLLASRGLIDAVNYPTTNYQFTLSPPPGAPVVGGVSWLGEVYGPDGVSSEGITLFINSNDTAQATMTVASNVVGEVVLRASYLSTSNRLVFALPFLVVSRPSGDLLGIALQPSEHFMQVSNKVGLEVWGVYANNMQSQLFLAPNELSFLSSSDNSVATVKSNLIVTSRSEGTAFVTVGARGFTNTATVQIGRVPEIVSSPQTVIAYAGGSSSFAVTAIGTAPLTNQWRKDGSVLAGATNVQLIFTNLLTADSGIYQMHSENGFGSALSRAQRLIVLSPTNQAPVIVSAAGATKANVGGSTVLSVDAVGDAPFSYQWSLNGIPVFAATNSSLAVTNLSRSTAGTYSVIISNAVGFVGANDLRVLVQVPQRLLPPVRLSNGFSILFGDSDGNPMNSTYAVDFDLLASTNLSTWFSVDNPVTATNGLLRIDDTNAPVSPQKFYQIIGR